MHVAVPAQPIVRAGVNVRGTTYLGAVMAKRPSIATLSFAPGVNPTRGTQYVAEECRPTSSLTVKPFAVATALMLCGTPSRSATCCDHGSSYQTGIVTIRDATVERFLTSKRISFAAP